MQPYDDQRSTSHQPFILSACFQSFLLLLRQETLSSFFSQGISHPNLSLSLRFSRDFIRIRIRIRIRGNPFLLHLLVCFCYQSHFAWKSDSLSSFPYIFYSYRKPISTAASPFALGKALTPTHYLPKVWVFYLAQKRNL